ncbi:MAG: hypothetical protein ABSD75_27550 [Terriglobales bacterium]|jgi:hypothetical protein
MDIEEKRETGSSLIVVGFGVWMMDLLAAFFLPSAITHGQRATFLDVIVALGVLGLVLLIVGYTVRGKSRAE